MIQSLIKGPNAEKRAPCILSKVDVINMLCGMELLEDRICERMQAHGYMVKQDKQLETDPDVWLWNRDALATQPIEALLTVYISIKNIKKPKIEML